DFTRRLLGVLETTTQGLDRKIDSLGSLIHPRTAPPRWLDAVARWLGVPWDDVLDEKLKRAVLLASPEILAARGTRAGLERLLAALFPESPRRFTIIDYTAEHDVSRIGGAGRVGGHLPMPLGGLPANSVTLSRRAVLNQARLCRNDLCADP